MTPEKAVDLANRGCSHELCKELLKTIKERDELRRQLSMIAVGKVGKSGSMSPDAVEYAEKRGWDCWDQYKKELE